jgi:acyl CoA:acetate/3-ketoacid CoA transferase
MTAPFPGWLLRLANAATRDQAQAIARNALLNGATSGDVITALTDWDELQVKQVQVIPRRMVEESYDPSPEPVQRRTS